MRWRLAGDRSRARLRQKPLTVSHTRSPKRLHASTMACRQSLNESSASAWRRIKNAAIKRRANWRLISKTYNVPARSSREMQKLLRGQQEGDFVRLI